MNDPVQLPSATVPHDASIYRPENPINLLMHCLSTAMLGSLLGVAIGFVVWAAKPPQYRAVAMIQVTPPRAWDHSENLKNHLLPQESGAYSLPGGDVRDDVLIIQSRAALEEAIEIGDLNLMHRLSEKSSDEMISWIRDRNRLTVRPGTSEAATRIIEVAFRCVEAELAAQVVAAVVAGYEKYIARESEQTSRDQLEALARFSDEYDKRLKYARSEYLKLAKATSLAQFGDEQDESIAKECEEVHLKIDDLRYRETRYKALIATIDEAIDDESSDLEVVFSMLIRNNPSFAQLGPPSLEIPSGADEKTAARTALSARLKWIMKSMHSEIESWHKEVDLLQQIAAEQHRTRQEQQSAELQLKVIRQEIELIQDKSHELSAALERINMHSQLGGKTVKRLEIPKLGLLDRSDLRSYLTVPGFIGGATFASLFILATTLRGLRKVK